MPRIWQSLSHNQSWLLLAYLFACLLAPWGSYDWSDVTRSLSGTGATFAGWQVLVVLTDWPYTPFAVVVILASLVLWLLAAWRLSNSGRRELGYGESLSWLVLGIAVVLWLVVAWAFSTHVAVLLEPTVLDMTELKFGYWLLPGGLADFVLVRLGLKYQAQYTRVAP